MRISVVGTGYVGLTTGVCLAEKGHSVVCLDKDAAKVIVENMDVLVKFYPRHIEKEDKHFFYPILDYFNAGEQDAMLREFYEFDRRMIHEKYRKVVEAAGGGTVAIP